MVEELSTVEAESVSYPPGSVREAFIVDQAVALGAIFPHSIGRWRYHLSVADIEVLRPAIGPLLVELGYEQGLDWASGRSSTQLDRQLGFPRPRSFSP